MSSEPGRGGLVVLSGPSGCGKTTIGGRLLDYPGIERVVTATSRPPRVGEEHGRDYMFYTPEEFRARAERGEFLEYVETLGNYYGTPAAAVEEIVSSGKFAVLIIDIKGAEKVRNTRNEGIYIFLMPPSTEELRRRLESRGTEDGEAVERRLELAGREMEEKTRYDHVVLNDTVERAVRKILDILRKHGYVAAES
jgi:guanylate kinase